MSVLIISKWDAGQGLDEDMYWRLSDEMGTRDTLPETLERHVFGGNATDGFVVSEVWSSEEAFGEFMQSKLGPASHKLECPKPSSVTVLPVLRQTAG